MPMGEVFDPLAGMTSFQIQAHNLALDTIERLQNERDQLQAELRMVDEALARRPAIAEFHTRYQKIGHACETAKQADQLRDRLQVEKRRLDLLEQLGFSTTSRDSEVIPEVHNWPYKAEPGVGGFWALAWVSSDFKDMRSCLDAALEKMKKIKESHDG